MDFPSSEGALMTISFLTFAVFLIKLVLVIHANSIYFVEFLLLFVYMFVNMCCRYLNLVFFPNLKKNSK